MVYVIQFYEARRRNSASPKIERKNSGAADAALCIEPAGR